MEQVRINKFRTVKHSHLALKEFFHIFRKEDLLGLMIISRFVLRRKGLDELPELMNVLMRYMSLVGPLPGSYWDLQMMKENDSGLYNRRKFSISKPGITGYCQIYGNRQKGVLILLRLMDIMK